MAYIQNPVDLFAKNNSGEAQRLICDQWGNIATLSPEHYWTHLGWGFEAGFRWSEATAIADNATADMVFQVIDSVHIIWEVSASGDCEIDYYDSPTYTLASPENQVTIFNKNQYSINTSNNVIYAGPTVSDVGTQDAPQKFVPGGAHPFNSGGSDGGFAREKIWKPGSPITEKLIRVTNRSGAAMGISITFEWYQPQNES